MGSARNAINVLSSDVVIACGVGGAGTASEIALALKAKRPVILLNDSEDSRRYFAGIGGTRVSAAETVEQVISLARGLLSAR
jgi:predicted Rossmann-fold nucleotide-binding protein